MKLFVAGVILLLPGCAYNQVESLTRCRNDATCAASVPGSGHGPPHQAATGSTTGRLPQR